MMQIAKGIICQDAVPQDITLGSFIEPAAALARSGRRIFTGSSGSWSAPGPVTSKAEICPSRPEGALAWIGK